MIVVPFNPLVNFKMKKSSSNHEFAIAISTLYHPELNIFLYLSSLSLCGGGREKRETQGTHAVLVILGFFFTFS
jgi:hypothetical protein